MEIRQLYEDAMYLHLVRNGYDKLSEKKMAIYYIQDEKVKLPIEY